MLEVDIYTSFSSIMLELVTLLLLLLDINDLCFWLQILFVCLCYKHWSLYFFIFVITFDSVLAFIAYMTPFFIKNLILD